MASNELVIEEKQFDPKIEKHSVVDTYKVGEHQSPSVHPYMIQLASLASSIPQWGVAPVLRDKALREFWPSEPLLASAVYSVSVRNASFAWEIIGSDPEKPNPKNTIRAVDRMLRYQSSHGRGWHDLMLKTSQDLYCQDNAVFWELVRKGGKESPVVSINQLDSARCLRTGNPEYPVIYTDIRGVERILRYWEVSMLEELPSPIEGAFNQQVCAISRCLLAAEVLRDIAIYKKEKVGGTFTRAIDVIGGVTQQNITDALTIAAEQNLNRGLYRYSVPVLIPGIDPSTTLSSIHIDLASLPDNFDEDVSYRWYIAQLAMAFGVDYQEFAPLMSGNLGSSQQSEILHLKTRGKGPALIMSLIESIINGSGIIPANVTFRFKEQDLRSEAEKAEASFTRAKKRSMQLKSGEIDAEAARVLAVEDGDIPEWLAKEIDKRDKENAKKEEMLPPTPEQPNSEFGPEQIQSGVDSNDGVATKLQQSREAVSRVALKDSSINQPGMYALFSLDSASTIFAIQDNLRFAVFKDTPENKICWVPSSAYHLSLLSSPLVTEDQLQRLYQRFYAEYGDIILETKLHITGVDTFKQDDYTVVILKVDKSKELAGIQKRLYEIAKELDIPVGKFTEPKQFKPHIALAYVSTNIKVPKLKYDVEVNVGEFRLTRDLYFTSAAIIAQVEETYESLGYESRPTSSETLD